MVDHVGYSDAVCGPFLDAEHFSFYQPAYRVAVAISAHAERARAEYRKTEKPVSPVEMMGFIYPMGYVYRPPSGMVALVASKKLLTEPDQTEESCNNLSYLSDRTPWYEFANDHYIISKIANEVSMQEDDVLFILTHIIRPPNWREYRLMHRYSGFLKSVQGMGKRIRENALSKRGEIAAAARYAQDPKQAAKAQVKGHWDGWQQTTDLYESKAHFAKKMMAKYPEITSQRAIANWCRGWEKSNR